jgi:hypothetical protein
MRNHSVFLREQVILIGGYGEVSIGFRWGVYPRYLEGW